MTKQSVLQPVLSRLKNALARFGLGEDGAHRQRDGGKGHEREEKLTYQDRRSTGHEVPFHPARQLTTSLLALTQLPAWANTISRATPSMIVIATACCSTLRPSSRF
jgi:hypothetical protein